MSKQPTELLPAPSQNAQNNQSQRQADENPAGDTRGGNSSGGRNTPPGGGAGTRRRADIRSAEECVAALGQLPGLITMGLLSPAQANAIARSLREVLRYHETQRAEAATGTTVHDDDLLRAVRENPQVLGLIEPLLTDAQVDMLMREATDE